MTDLVFTSIVPLPLIIAMACVMLALGLYGLVKGVRGWVLRSLMGALLILALLDIRITSETREPLDDIVLAVLDRSPSQTLGEREAQSQQALVDLERELAALTPDSTTLRVVRSATSLSRNGTSLMGTLREATSGLPRNRLAGVILVTDGQVHDAEMGSSLETPVHVLLTGERSEIDRRIEIIEAPRYGLVGETVDVRFRVEDNGIDALRARVILERPGQESQVLTVLPGTENTMVVPVDHAGPSALTLSVESVDGEISTANNKVALALNGVRDRLRVLLISGLPHQGQRTWRNLLKSDAAVDLVHFTILRPPEKDDLAPLTEMSLITFPVRELFEEKLPDFDLLIFDRYFQRDVLPGSYFGNIVDYVRAGGAALVAAGPDFAGPRSLHHSSLEAILPAEPTGRVIEQSFVPRPTDLGARHPVTAGLLDQHRDGGRWLRLVEGIEKGGDTVLRGADGQPLLILERNGEGRVALLLSDHIWLWARGYDGGGPHAPLLRNIAHWLMQEPELEEERLSVRSDEDSLIIARQSLGYDEVAVQVQGPDGAVRDLLLDHQSAGRLEQRVPVDAPGLYEVSDGTDVVLAAVGALNPKEWQDPRATATVLEPVAAQSGGGVFWLEDGMPDFRRVDAGDEAFGNNWLGLVRNDAFEVTGFEQTTLLPGWLLAFLGLGGLMGLWYWEGRRKA